MGGKTIVVLIAAGGACIAANLMLSRSSRPAAATGERIVGDFDLAAVSRVEIGTNTILSATAGGWVVETMQNYPADKSKIAGALMQLQDLKAEQIVRGRTLAEKTVVRGRDAAGNDLFSVTLGERHANWNFGRYVEYKGAAVLTGAPLDMFDDAQTVWCDTKIIDDPWVSFNILADKNTADDITGFSTGVTARVTIGGNTNRTATVGTTAKDGSGRYLKLDGQDWIYIVPEYSVEKLLPKPAMTGDERQPEAETQPAKAGDERQPEAETQPAKAEGEQRPAEGGESIPPKAADRT